MFLVVEIIVKYFYSFCTNASCGMVYKVTWRKFPTNSSIRDIKQLRGDGGNENVTKTIVLISKTLALHVRYTLLYISMSSTALNDNVKCPNSRFYGEREHTRVNVSYLSELLSSPTNSSLA